MDKYSFLRVVGPIRSVPGVITNTLQVRKILYMIDKVQARRKLASGHRWEPQAAGFESRRHPLGMAHRSA